MHAAASRLKRAQCQRDGQRLPDRLLRDCRWRCCLTILVSGWAGAGGSGSDRPLPNLRSIPPSLELGLCPFAEPVAPRSEEHTSELQSRPHLVCRLLLEKKNQHPYPHLLLQKNTKQNYTT